LAGISKQYLGSLKSSVQVLIPDHECDISVIYAAGQFELIRRYAHRLVG
jgi:hypothetical protein